MGELDARADLRAAVRRRDVEILLAAASARLAPEKPWLHPEQR